MEAIFHFIDSDTYPYLIFNQLTIKNISDDSKSFILKKKDLKTKKLINNVLLDTGAGRTYLPTGIVSLLSLDLDTEHLLVEGATGIGFSQKSLTPVSLELKDTNGNKITKTIIPNFITKIIPKAQIDHSVLDGKEFFYPNDLNDLDISFTLETYYSVKK